MFRYREIRPAADAVPAVIDSPLPERELAIGVFQLSYRCAIIVIPTKVEELLI